MAENISLNERADALERKMSDDLDVLLSKSALFNMADGKLGASNMGSDITTKYGKHYLMDDDPRLPKMPAKPTLLDYFTYRAKGINHLLQSATHALKASMPEKTILACLLHDIAQCNFHQERSRLLGRAADRAIRRRRGMLGGARAPGAAFLP